MKKDLEAIYEWAERNEKKFEQMHHGPLKEISVEAYTTPNGDEIQIKDTVKDLGILATDDLRFKEQIKKATTECRITAGNILRTFGIREKSQ